jgi:hypothetical protein
LCFSFKFPFDFAYSFPQKITIALLFSFSSPLVSTVRDSRSISSKKKKDEKFSQYHQLSTLVERKKRKEESDAVLLLSSVHGSRRYFVKCADTSLPPDMPADRHRPRALCALCRLSDLSLLQH